MNQDLRAHENASRHRGVAFAALVVVVMLGSVLTACGGGDDFDVKAFCTKQTEFETAMDDTEGDDPAAMQNAVTLINDVQKSAPDELKDDFSMIASAMSTMADAADEALALGESDPAKALEIVTAAVEGLNAEEMDAAGNAIDEYTTANC